MLLSDKNSTSTFWQNPSLYSLYNDAQSAQGITGSTWFRRTFDPQGANMIFNAQEAQNARDFNALEAKKTRDFNAEQSRLAREWEEKMSNTAYSRAIKDLRANGLNPYLVMSGGASTPSGQVLGGVSAYGSQASANGSGNATALASSLNSASNVIGTVWNVVKSAMLIAKYGL